MKISRELAIKILRYLDEHKDFYFPFFVMCREYTEENNDFVEIEPDEWKMIASDDKYKTFELWENLQNLYEDTMQLMAKGFIEKIANESKERLQVWMSCQCGNEIALKLVGGQYQYSYRGTCACGRDWLLEDLSKDDEEAS